MRHPTDPSLYRRVDITAFDPQGFDPEKKNAVKSRKPKIRCPRCQWQPARSSTWGCFAMGAPEHFMGGCGMSWNTFDTRGRCPGCSYQWVHTSCLSCGETSRHQDWYEDEGKRA